MGTIAPLQAMVKNGEQARNNLVEDEADSSNQSLNLFAVRLLRCESISKLESDSYQNKIPNYQSAIQSSHHAKSWCRTDNPCRYLKTLRYIPRLGCVGGETHNMNQKEAKI